ASGCLTHASRSLRTSVRRAFPWFSTPVSILHFTLESAPGPPANPPGCRRDVRASHLRPGAPMIGRVIPAHPPGRPHRAPFALVLLAALAWAGLPPGVAHAQSLDANRWVTDGEVDAIVPWGNTLYIGGSFGYVGPNTGGWVEVTGGGDAT